MAVKGAAVGGKRLSGGGQQHPYASAQGTYDQRGGSDFGGGGYRSGQATPAAGMSTTGGQTQTNQGNGDYQDEGAPKGGFSLMRLLTCRCG